MSPRPRPHAAAVARPPPIDLNRFLANSMSKPRTRFALGAEHAVEIQRIIIHAISVVTLTPSRSLKRRPKKQKNDMTTLIDWFFECPERVSRHIAWLAPWVHLDNLKTLLDDRMKKSALPFAPFVFLLAVGTIATLALSGLGGNRRGYSDRAAKAKCEGFGHTRIGRGKS
jgi:hypothetical protein